MRDWRVQPNSDGQTFRLVYGEFILAVSYLASGSKSQRGLSVGVLFFIVVVVALPGLVILTTNSDLGMRSFVAVLAVTYFGVRLTQTVSSSAVAPVATTFWMFSYISFGIVPLAQVQTGRTSLLGLGASDDSFYLGFWVILGGSFVFDLCYRNLRPKTAIISAITQPLRSSYPMAGARVLAAISFFLCALYIQTGGGVQSFFASRQELNEGLGGLVSEGSGESIRAIISVTGTVPVLFVLLFYLFLKRVGGRFALIDVLLFIVTLALNLIVNNPIVNPRYWFLSVVFGVILVAFRFTSSSWSITVLLGLFLALIVFPVSDIFRYDSGAPVMVGSSNVWEMISVKDYDQFTMLQNTLLYVDNVGANYFFSLLGCLLFWIPRPLWPDKPSDTGVSVGEFIHSSNTNLSSPLWAEAWVNGTWVGVLVFAVVLGWAAVRLDDRFSGVNAKDDVGFILLASVLSGYMFILMRGPLLQSMSRLAFILLLAWLFSIVLRPRGPLKHLGRPV